MTLGELMIDQIIVCKALALLKTYDSNEGILSKEEQERLPILSEIEMRKLVMLEKELGNVN